MGTDIFASFKDIAEASGCSQSTVSRVLNHKGEISQETRERVMTAARKLGYHENRLVSGFQTGRTQTVGLIYDYENPFFQKLFYEIWKQLAARGYMTISCASSTDPDMPGDFELLRRLVEHRVDGVIFVPRDDFAGNDYFNGLISRGIPVISIDRKTPADIDFVGTDDYLGGRLAAAHLRETGRRYIGYIAAPDYVIPSIHRCCGMRDFCAEHPDMSFDVICRCDGNRLEPSEIRSYFAMHPETDAVAGFFDTRALQAYVILREMGLRVPEDVALIGFGNLFSELPTVLRLTTLDQRPDLIAQTAARRLLERLGRQHGEPFRPVELRIPPELIVRESTPVKQENAIVR